ncbi:hypothetical protein WKT22_03047 [Candidatus Lokiarchaeum ossiferum]
MINNLKTKYPVDVEITSITEGFIRSKSVYDSLLLSDKLPQLYSLETKFLIIYAIYPKLSRITCYPIKSTLIWKLKIVLTSSNAKIVSRIASFLKMYEIIHTTGISAQNEKYIVENYITGKNSWEQAIDLSLEINKIAEVEKCSIEIIE